MSSQAVGIYNVKTADKTDGRIYDISGKQATNATNGIVISNGKKYIEK